MDKEQAPVIDATKLRILLVRLTKCSFEVNRDFTQTEKGEINLQYGITLERQYPTEYLGVLRFGMGAFLNEENAPFRVHVEYEGHFQVNDGHAANLKEYMRYNAVATLVPYVRETISTISTRAGFPPLIVPPLNVKMLADEQEVVSRAAE